MVSKRILDFIFKHPGVEIRFRQFFNNEKVIVLTAEDPYKGFRYSHALNTDCMNLDAYIKYVLEIVENAMYGDKEEHNE